MQKATQLPLSLPATENHPVSITRAQTWYSAQSWRHGMAHGAEAWEAGNGTGQKDQVPYATEYDNQSSLHASCRKPSSALLAHE